MENTNSRKKKIPTLWALQPAVITANILAHFLSASRKGFESCAWSTKQNKGQLSLLRWGRWCHASEGWGARIACVSSSLSQDKVCKPRRGKFSPGRTHGVDWRAQSHCPNLCKTQKSEAWSRSLELGNILLISKNKSEDEGMVCGCGKVAAGDQVGSWFRLRWGHRAGAGREHASPKIAFTTVCPGGYFSFLF